MTEHKPILTDEEVRALINGNLLPVEVSLGRLERFARNIERYLIKKITKQLPPSAWLNEETGDVMSNELKAEATILLKSYNVPLHNLSELSRQG